MRIESITPTASVALADKARGLQVQGRRIVKLQTGDPDFPSHPLVIESAHVALLRGKTHYSHTAGEPELRLALAESVAGQSGGPIDLANVLVTTGAAHAIASIFAALIEPGKSVVVVKPNWSTVDSLITMLGGEVVPLRWAVGDELKAKLSQLSAPNICAIYINSPSNPTGNAFCQSDIDQVVSWAESRGAYVLSDEVYRHFYYTPSPQGTLLKWLGRYDKAIFIDSFSKKYAMTGWRVGYCVADPKVIAKISLAAQLTTTHVAPCIQAGALTALQSAEVSAYADAMRDEYRVRRSKSLELCHSLGLEVDAPRGAFYLFVPTEGLEDGSVAENLLETAGVCVVPGSAYGLGGEGFLRITYATGLNDVIEGIEAISKVISRLRN
jgi:aspartate aminotransferase